MLLMGGMRGLEGRTCCSVVQTVDSVRGERRAVQACAECRGGPRRSGSVQARVHTCKLHATDRLSYPPPSLPLPLPPPHSFRV